MTLASAEKHPKEKVLKALVKAATNYIQSRAAALSTVTISALQLSQSEKQMAHTSSIIFSTGIPSRALLLLLRLSDWLSGVT